MNKRENQQSEPKHAAALQRLAVAGIVAVIISPLVAWGNGLRGIGIGLCIGATTLVAVTMFLVGKKYFVR